MDSDEITIDVQSLTKMYPIGMMKNKGNGKLAVDRISFRVKKGEIFGMLGPNGAGKTTTIKMLSTLLLPTSGTATVLGLNVRTEPLKIRERINLITGGERGLYYRLSGRQNLMFFSDLYRVPIRIRDKRIEELIEVVGLEDSADRKVEDYSRGMKQRLHLAKGLVNDPEILFLDEPTIGLDPEIARGIRGLIDEMSSSGRTILLSTHDMPEAEELCDRIALISKGRIVALDTPFRLRELVKEKSVIEIVAESVTETMIESIKGLSGVEKVTIDQDYPKTTLRIQIEGGKDLVFLIANQLSGSRVHKICTEEPSMEDAFISLVNRDD